MIPKRTVILFVLTGFGIFLLLVVSTSLKQGWFAPHEDYTVEFPSGDGLSEGTAVSISGLKAGRVTSVDLGASNHVVVKIRVQKRYADRIREDSRIVVGRPFIIGEKMLSITPGSMDKPLVRPGSVLQGEESLEITDMLSGGRMAPYFATFTKLLDQLRIVIEGDGSKNSMNLVEVYKQAYKSLQAVETMSREVQVIRKDFAASPEMLKIVRDLSKSTGDVQQLLANMNGAMPALTSLSGDVGKLMPELSKALGETVFTLQAMQRTFILSGGVARLKEDQEREKKESRERSMDRAPASAK